MAVSQAAAPGPGQDGFAAELVRWQARVEQALAARLPPASELPGRLHEAMRYSVLGGGKRIRAALVYATARTVGLEETVVDAVACAIECVHAYSLVHDDLPAMDDDDLRRGRPTCHRAYDEGTALLVGDALQPLAIALLVADPGLPAAPAVRLKLVELLAAASGSLGLVGGQAIDLAAAGTTLDAGAIEAMHARKTGALIRASVLMAAACAPDLGAAELAALGGYAADIGLAFQIQDDLLDVLGDTATLGKATGADRERAKPTYPQVLGVPAAQARMAALHDAALAALAPFGPRAAPLAGLADWLIARRY